MTLEKKLSKKSIKIENLFASLFFVQSKVTDALNKTSTLYKDDAAVVSVSKCLHDLQFLLLCDLRVVLEERSLSTHEILDCPFLRGRNILYLMCLKSVQFVI